MVEWEGVDSSSSLIPTLPFGETLAVPQPQTHTHISLRPGRSRNNLAPSARNPIDDFRYGVVQFSKST